MFKLSVGLLIFGNFKKTRYSSETESSLTYKYKEIGEISRTFLRNFKLSSLPLDHNFRGAAYRVNCIRGTKVYILFSLWTATQMCLCFSWLHNRVVHCTCKVYYAVHRIWGWYEKHTSRVISSRGELFLFLQEATGQFFMAVSHIKTRKDPIDIADSSIMLLYKFLCRATVVLHVIINIKSKGGDYIYSFII
jgi:hypothetical protein